jgi:hypothetical protein
MKNFFKFRGAFVLGLLFSGAVDLDDLKFRRNIGKLKKEKWFKELSDNGRFYESIYQNEALKEYLTQKGIVERILHDKDEKEQFLRFIHKSF